MPTNEELLERIKVLEKEVDMHKHLILGLWEFVNTMPKPENLAELGRYLALIKGLKP